MQGHAAMGKLRSVTDPATRAREAQKAVGLLFQAAACLGPRAEYLAHSAAESKRWLHRVLQHLQRSMTGCADAETPEVGPAAVSPKGGTPHVSGVCVSLCGV